VTRFVFSPRLYQNVLDELGAGGGGEFDRAFYNYKFSLFFVDSNNVGLALLCLIALMLVFHESVGGKRIFFAYLLMFATISRASILAALCQYAIYKLWRFRRWALVVIAVVGVVAILTAMSAFVSSGPEDIQEADPSFATKLMLLQKMGDIYSEAPLQSRLFGFGAGNTEGLIAFAAHNIAVTLTVEFGIVGSMLVMVYVWLLARSSVLAGYLLIVPILINGFSLFLPSMPYFYLVLGLLASMPTWPPGLSDVEPSAVPSPLTAAAEVPCPS
jgi:hypothetical protein